jgi:hypothetical protein
MIRGFFFFSLDIVAKNCITFLWTPRAIFLSSFLPHYANQQKRVWRRFFFVSRTTTNSFFAKSCFTSSSFLYIWAASIIFVPATNVIIALTFASYVLQPFHIRLKLRDKPIGNTCNNFSSFKLKINKEIFLHQNPIRIYYPQNNFFLPANPSNNFLL